MPVWESVQPRAVLVRFYTVLSPAIHNNATLRKTVNLVAYCDRTMSMERQLFIDPYCSVTLSSSVKTIHVSFDYSKHYVYTDL